MTDQQTAPQWSKDDIREVAKWQKKLIWGFGYLPLAAVLVVTGITGDALRFLAMLSLPPLFGYCVYCTYKLAHATRMPMRWLIILLPVVNLAIMVSLNSQATLILQQNGLRVGLEGANVDSVDS